MTETRQIKVDRFFQAAKIGALAWLSSLSIYLVLIALGAYQTGLLIWLNYAVLLCCFAALIVQFRHRSADEFTQESWNTSTSLAFMATVAWMLFAIQIEAIINWAIALSTGKPVTTAFAYWWTFQMPLSAFYAVFWINQRRTS